MKKTKDMKKNKGKQLSALGAELVAGLSAFRDVLEAGEPIEKHFTVRTVKLDLQSRPYEAADVKQVRRMLNASQALLAMFLGVSVKTLCSWEQGTRPVPKIACRFMDEIVANREVWRQRIVQGTGVHPKRTGS
jgi:DNA-binding transcriptional regulator YiaG